MSVIAAYTADVRDTSVFTSFNGSISSSQAPRHGTYAYLLGLFQTLQIATEHSELYVR